jgi:hypothetical protein
MILVMVLCLAFGAITLGSKTAFLDLVSFPNTVILIELPPYMADLVLEQLACLADGKQSCLLSLQF